VLTRAQRVLERADILVSLTEEPGRITRPLGTPAPAAAMERVLEWMEAAGLTTRRDGLGNLVGRIGSGPGTLVVGSHLDSVANAGRYDGILGVLVGLECVQELPLALELVAFADEEGLRFQSRYLGSRAYLGHLEESDLELRDAAGVTVREATGAVLGPPLAPDDLRAYFEVHIEQGLQMIGEALRRKRGVRVRWSPIAGDGATPLTLAPALAQVLPDAPLLAGGAGHDAVTFAQVTDTAMLFVRCAGGVSHHPDESVTAEDVAAAIEAARRFVRVAAEKAARVA
jgi:acetylornithine deacetylase/succinyl-diaminopimelate desuccinylase-like protein